MSDTDVHPSEVDDNWHNHINSDEEQLVAVYDARIERQKRILSDTIADRNRIRRRAIKRMRRANGKA